MNLDTIKLCGRFVGKKELVRHMKDGKLTYSQMAKAKCFECMGGYADGAADCKIRQCPLYPVMPYRESNPCPPDPPICPSTGNNGDQGVSGYQEPEKPTNTAGSQN